MNDTESLAREVQDHLNTHHGSYMLCNNDLLQNLAQTRNLPEMSHLIYAIYSRADKQNGQTLKPPIKIAHRLRALRSENPKAKVMDVRDIIGVTIVVRFPSDIQVVARFLNRDESLSNFRVVRQEVVEDLGFNAMRLELVSSKIARGDVPAEIVIRTVLHDGWAAKTRGLIYKPDGKLAEALKKHVNNLGEVLQRLDAQSEIIRDTIHETLNADKTRRKVARQALIGSTLASAPPPIQKLIKEINQARDIYAMAPSDSAETKEFDRKFQQAIDEGHSQKDLCRVLTLFASLRVMGDYNDAVMSRIAIWAESSMDAPKDLVKPLLFASIASDALGRLDWAVDKARTLVKHCEKYNLKKDLISAKGNLAYFASELAYGGDDVANELEREALECSEFAFKQADRDNDGPLLDTRGAVLIAWGKTEQEVRDGLALCERAYRLSLDRLTQEQEKAQKDLRTKGAKDKEATARLTNVKQAAQIQKPVAEAFFKLHQRRAYQRLLEWE